MAMLLLVSVAKIPIGPENRFVAFCNATVLTALIVVEPATLILPLPYSVTSVPENVKLPVPVRTIGLLTFTESAIVDNPSDLLVAMLTGLLTVISPELTLVRSTVILVL